MLALLLRGWYNNQSEENAKEICFYEIRYRCSQADFHKSLNLHENPIKPDGIRVFQNAAKI